MAKNTFEPTLLRKNNLVDWYKPTPPDYQPVAALLLYIRRWRPVLSIRNSATFSNKSLSLQIVTWLLPVTNISDIERTWTCDSKL